MIRRLARQALAGFAAWRHRRRVARAAPEIAFLAAELEKLRRSHRPTRRLMRAQRDALHSRMARELGVSAPQNQG